MFKKNKKQIVLEENKNPYSAFRQIGVWTWTCIVSDKANPKADDLTKQNTNLGEYQY